MDVHLAPYSQLRCGVGEWADTLFVETLHCYQRLLGIQRHDPKQPLSVRTLLAYERGKVSSFVVQLEPVEGFLDDGITEILGLSSAGE